MTQEQVMKDTRRMLFFLAAFFFAWGVAIVFRPGEAATGTRHQADGVVLLGLICVIAGIARSFWFRLCCIAVWLLGIVSSLIVLRTSAFTVIVIFFFGARMIYRMLKYHGVLEEPLEPEVLVEENPFTPLAKAFARGTSDKVTRGPLIIVVVVLIIIVLLNPWYERKQANWSQELKKNQSQSQSLGHPGDASRGQNAVEISPDARQSRTPAFDLYRAQKWTEAIAVFDELIRESDSDAELIYWHGMAHWQLGHTDQALQDFRRIIELEPTNFNVHLNANRILSQQARWDEVLEMWDGYIGRDPNNAGAYIEREVAYFQKGDRVAAGADAAKACEMGRSDACSLAERLK